MTFILYAILAWFVYKLIVGLVIPLYRTTRKIRKGVREMNERMNQQANQQNGFQTSPKSTSTQKKKAPAGDYIDFEEIK